MTEEPKTSKMLVVAQKYIILVTFILGVFISFSVLYIMIPIGDPTPWMESILMLCIGFFLSTVLLKPGQVIDPSSTDSEDTTI